MSQPNPIADIYPTSVTGTVNGTYAILPIPMCQARAMIPEQYGILESFRDLLDGFPEDMYPAVLEGVIDHDVGIGSGFKIEDFLRFSVSYPFVDRLNDGYTAMVYVPALLITNDSLAITGTETYGIPTEVATFDPPCDGYAFVPGKEATYQKVYVNSSLVASSMFRPHHSPYSIQFWKNVTNQPQFGSNPAFCDNQLRFFNYSVTEAPYEPQAVKGEVTVGPPFFSEMTTFRDVYGLKSDNAYIENNYLQCESLQGYHGTGSGD